VSARRRRTNEAWPQALWRLFGQSRRRYGGFLVHLGVTLMAVGVVGTRAYPVEAELVVTPDEPVTAAGYTFVYQGLVQEPVGDRTSTRASLLIYEGGAYLTTLEPRLDRYREFDQTVAVPALRAGLWEDLYVVLAGWEEGGTTATLKLFVNPLAGFLWVGGLALLVGGAVALWPSAPAERLSAVQARWRTAGLVVGGLLLVVAGVAMWGSGPGTRLVDSLGSGLPGRSARLRPGEPASDFALDLLHGSTFTLSDLRGRVVVVNFWATWCPSCEDELDDLQAVWVEYRPEEVVLVGIAVQQDATVVQEMASRLGLTYPLGLDPRGRIGLAYGITAVPETFVVDPEGQVAFVHVGPVSAGQLRQELDRLLTP
jgi:peroxiredoxin